MKKSKDIFTDKELEMVNLLMQDYESTNDIQSKLKRLFAGTIEQMLEAKVNEHLIYEKHCAEGSNKADPRDLTMAFRCVLDYDHPLFTCVNNVEIISCEINIQTIFRHYTFLLKI